MRIRNRLSYILFAGVLSCMIMAPVFAQEEGQEGGRRRGQRGRFGQRGQRGEGGQRGQRRGGFSQRGGFGFQRGGGGNSIFTVLKNENVVKDLSITEDEQAFIKLIEEETAKKSQDSRQESMSKMREIFQNIDRNDQDAMTEARAKMSEMFQKMQQEATAEVDKNLKDVLGDRLARAHQITWQAEVQWNGMGVVFRNPTLREKLGITDTQNEDYQTAAREIMQEFGGFGRGQGRRGRPGQDSGDQGENTRESREESMNKMRAKVNELAEATLTDEQKKKWATLIGEKISYEIDRPQRVRRAGGPQGRSGRGDA